MKAFSQMNNNELCELKKELDKKRPLSQSELKKN